MPKSKKGRVLGKKTGIQAHGYILQLRSEADLVAERNCQSTG